MGLVHSKGADKFFSYFRSVELDNENAKARGIGIGYTAETRYTSSPALLHKWKREVNVRLSPGVDDRGELSGDR